MQHKRVSTVICLLLILFILCGCGARRRLAARESIGGFDSHVESISPPSQTGRLAQDPSPSTQRTPILWEGDLQRSLLVNGVERFYRIYVPAGYSRERPIPLVIVLHGGGGSGEQIEATSGMNQKADTAGFLVVYPDGSGRRFLTWNAGACCGYAQRNNVNDVSFIRALIDDMMKDFAIDRSRVFVAGMSNGAMMAYRLACELSERIAAVAVVAGTMTVTTCHPTRLVSILHIHGTADDNVPFSGGIGPRSITRVDYQSVPSSVESWVRRNATRRIPQVTYQRGNVTCETYDGGKERTAVSLCTVDKGGHVWPGGRKDPHAMLSASDFIWNFFSAHARR